MSATPCNMNATYGAYSACHSGLIEIDRFGDRHIGCVCNRWTWPASPMALPEADLEALRARS